MAIVCFVEDLTDDKKFGATTDLVMITHNMNKFVIMGLKESDDYAAFAFQAGRYIAIVANDITNKKAMSFLDLQNNENLAKVIATQFEDELKRIFMKTFYELRDSYQKNYDLVSLEVVKDNSAN